VDRSTEMSYLVQMLKTNATKTLLGLITHLDTASPSADVSLMAPVLQSLMSLCVPQEKSTQSNPMTAYSISLVEDLVAGSRSDAAARLLVAHSASSSSSPVDQVLYPSGLLKPAMALSLPPWGQGKEKVGVSKHKKAVLHIGAVDNAAAFVCLRYVPSERQRQDRGKKRREEKGTNRGREGERLH
jgi:hypothetical protein